MSVKTIAKTVLPKNVYVLLWKVKQAIFFRPWPRLKNWTGESRVLNACIAYNSAGGYCVPLASRHRGAAQAILNGATYEPDTIKTISNFCGKGDIIHAGTYFGDFIPHLSRCIEDKGIVWAFEPNKENYQCAQITCLLNSCSNVRLFNQGLGDDCRQLYLETEADSGQSLGGSSRVVQNAPVNKRHEVINIVPIDNVIPGDRHISVIHLDIEGFEQQALTGAMNTIRRCKPVLILETVPPRDWLEDNIFSLGYKESGKVHVNTMFMIQ